jgi:hypothetical protein
LLAIILHRDREAQVMVTTSGIARFVTAMFTAAAFGPGLSAQAETKTGKVAVQWLGQSAFRITSVTGKVILIDPWLTRNPKTPERYKDLKAMGMVITSATDRSSRNFTTCRCTARPD